MKKVLLIHIDEGDSTTRATFLGQEIEIHRIGVAGDASKAKALIEEYDGKVDAIGLEGMPAELTLGSEHRPHAIGSTLASSAKLTPVVAGGGIRPGIERWGIILADRAQPGIFSQKRILMVPGLNHPGMSQSFSRRASVLHYGDPIIYFALPAVPGVGSTQTLEQAAGPTLDQLRTAPFRRLYPRPGHPETQRDAKAFGWADVIAGDIGAIRRYAPDSLAHKTVVVESATQ